MRRFGGDDQTPYWSLTESETPETIELILKNALSDSLMPMEEHKGGPSDHDDPSLQYGNSLCEYELSSKLQDLKKEI